MTTAIILAAGRGSRLKDYSEELPKPLLSINGISIIENTVELLIKENIEDIIIVIGYQSETIVNRLNKYSDIINIKYIYNNMWSSSNNIYSVFLTLNYMEKDILLLEGDIWLNSNSLTNILSLENCNRALVSEMTTLMEGNYVQTDANNQIKLVGNSKTDVIPKKSMGEKTWKTINIYRLNEDILESFKTNIKRFIKNEKTDIYYEDALLPLLLENKIGIYPILNHQWYEIDDYYDYQIAKFIASSNKMDILKNQHGGYWRYPIKDFALIYNFHFPNNELYKKLEMRTRELILNYPSSSSSMENHLSAFYKVDPKNIIVSNGITEIIKIMPHFVSGKTMVIEPSFNEFYNVLEEGNRIVHRLKEENNFDIEKDNLIKHIISSKPSAVVLVNPNNPTGRMSNIEEIKEVYNTIENIGSTLILDESFIDFSEIHNRDYFIENLEMFPNLIVLRSMSKTFGIGGVRLGVTFTSNSILRSKIKNLLPIWNINGMAEEILMNLPRYSDDYYKSCSIVHKETQILYNELNNLRLFSPLKTFSNFILVKLNDDINKKTLLDLLIEDYGIYIKDCEGKLMDNSEKYLRISSRNQKDNQFLITSFKEIEEKLGAKNVKVLV